MCPRMMRVRRVSNANRPGSCSMRSGLQSSATTSIPSVGGTGRKDTGRESRGGVAMGKTGEEAPKSGSFSCFLPHFSAKIPLFSPAMRRQKTLARSGREIGAEKTSRPTEPTHDLREQTERCPPPKARWRASKRIAKVFSPDRNTAPSEKVAQRGLKVPLWACAREKKRKIACACGAKCLYLHKLYGPDSASGSPIAEPLSGCKRPNNDPRNR